MYAALATVELQTPVGASVKVTANAQGKFEIYRRTVTGWDRVGLQNGTIAFKEELWNYTLGGFGFDVAPSVTSGGTLADKAAAELKARKDKEKK